ncbi:MAG: cyclic nucleotide-binding domain-containing protein [Spirochaetales bacterium]|nr:cyclic nucleotide-binding domain-containing protein [Spirochaetales bacterium]MBR6200635.1 cyclic nucleotide-binding domain-containing protein [Spirochaetales bacterium]
MAAGLQLTTVNFPKGAYIIIEGRSPINYFFIIRSGKVSVTRDAEKGKTEMLNPGDFFGVIAAMSGHNSIETAMAVTDVSLIMVYKEQFPMLICKNNPVAMKIVLFFSRKLRELDTKIAELTLKSYAVEDVVNLFDIGNYYMQQKQYNEAFYAFYRFVQYCPTNSEVHNAKMNLQKIKSLSKAVYLGSSEELKRTYPDNTMVFCEHEPGNALYIVQSGKVKITKMVANKEVLLAVLKEGDIFGEMALLENKPRSASAISYGGCNLMYVNRENFKNMISQQPQTITRLICLLAERTWTVYRQLLNLQMKSKLQRTYDTLLIQLEKSKIAIKHGKSHTFEFGVAELTKMVGLTEEESQPIMMEIFKNGKVFKEQADRIIVSDIEELKKQVETTGRLVEMSIKRTGKYTGL